TISPGSSDTVTGLNVFGSAFRQNRSSPPNCPRAGKAKAATHKSSKERLTLSNPPTGRENENSLQPGSATPREPQSTDSARAPEGFPVPATGSPTTAGALPRRDRAAPDWLHSE